MDKSSDGLYASDEDIFDDEEDRQKSWSFDSSALLASLEKEFTYDKEKLVRARRILGGIPLPPNCTNPQISLDDVIARLKSPRLLLGGLIKNQQNVGNEIVAGHDVYLNRNEFVEELEVLRPELQKWFVSNETSSLLTTVPQRPVTASAKKRSRTNGWSASPKSRVNYLQRRKATFSALHSTSVPRTLTIDKGKLSKGKSENKEKQTSSSLKRALFQSPEKQTLCKSNSNSSLPIDCSVPSTSSGSFPQTPTRSQHVNWSTTANNEKKNIVQEKTSSEKKKCWRSLQFTEGDSKEKGSSTKKLSKMHHKKMLWAVDHLLKSEGVLRADPEYRQLCLLLYRETTAVWLKEYENHPRLPGTSTSNEMLRLANTMITRVEQKAGVKMADIRGRRRSSDSENSKIPEYPSSVSSSLDASILNTRLASMDSECSRGFSNAMTSENIETVSVDSYFPTSDTLSEASFPPPTPPSRKVRNTPKKTPRKGGTPSKKTPAKTQNPVGLKTPVKTPVKTPRKADVTTPSKMVTPGKRTPRGSYKKVKLSPAVSEKSPETVGTENSCTTPRYPKRKRKEENEENSKKSKYAEESDATSTVSTPVSRSIGCDEETTDKENNSAIRNADMDSQNWSPIIIMKRMTRNRWSSQLKKKRVSSSMQQMKGVDESPNHQQPFLELEGPFMYRNAGDRALQCGEYIKVLLSGKKYIKWMNRLVKDLDVTPMCILVHPTSTGLELHIPIALTCDQQAQVVNITSNAVEEVLEDALLRLEMSEIPEMGFCGFTLEETEVALRKVDYVEQAARLYHLTGSTYPKPLFKNFQYALVSRKQHELKQYYQLEVCVFKMTAFIAKRNIDKQTILVHPSKCGSSKRIVLQLSIPLSLLPPGNPPSIDNIISDLRACQNCY